MIQFFADDTVVEQIEEEGDNVEKNTNCINCAAPLPFSGKCEYCGTINSKTRKNGFSHIIQIDMDGKSIMKAIKDGMIPGITTERR